MSEYCDQKGAPSGSSAYYRRLFAPAELQAELTALYAFLAETMSIARDVSEPGAARMKVAWWQSEIEALFEGRPRHPVTRALLPALAREGLKRDHFDAILAVVNDDIEHPGHADAGQMLERARRVAARQQLETELCGFSDVATREFAQRLGTAMELARILEDTRPDADNGMVLLPADEMQELGVRPADLLAAETSDGVRELLRRQCERALEGLEQARAALPDRDQDRQASGLVGLQLRQALLAEIARDGYRVIEHRIDLTPIRKFWIAWRTALRARRRSARASGKQIP